MINIPQLAEEGFKPATFPLVLNFSITIYRINTHSYIKYDDVICPRPSALTPLYHSENGPWFNWGHQPVQEVKAQSHTAGQKQFQNRTSVVASRAPWWSAPVPTPPPPLSSTITSLRSQVLLHLLHNLQARLHPPSTPPPPPPPPLSQQTPGHYQEKCHKHRQRVKCQTPGKKKKKRRKTVFPLNVSLSCISDGRRSAVRREK